MKVIIFGGFLGSGKTTLLLELAKYISENNLGKIAVIENEIGKIGIDDKFIEEKGYQVKSLYAGCICCTMVTNLVGCVSDIIKDETIDWVLIETTGVAYPHKVNEVLETYANIKAQIICVVDSERWKKLMLVTGHLLTEQIKSADVVMINKTDTISAKELDALKDEIRLINKEALVYGISTKDQKNQHIFQRIIN